MRYCKKINTQYFFNNFGLFLETYSNKEMIDKLVKLVECN